MIDSKQRKFGALCALAALAACSPAENAEAVAGEADAETAVALPATPNVVTVTTTDFAFEAPESIPAGLTTLRLVNEGPEAHHIQLVRLDEGYTLADLGKAMASHGPPPAWAHLVGGPNTPMPGAETQTTVYLPEGEYALVCVIPSPVDGQPHTAKGMVKPLTVTANAAADPAVEPHFDVQMALVDYGYDMSGDITAGRRTIRVENLAEQPHEVVFVKLAAGKTVNDVMAWFGTGMQGPPPAEFVGGTSSMDKGTVNYPTIDFESGAEYGLLCFHPDVKDGKPHIAHGMVRQIRIP